MNRSKIVEGSSFSRYLFHGNMCAIVRFRCTYSVYLEGIVLKTSMAVPGKSAVTFASTRPEDIAKATVTVFSRTVPIAVPGVAFLSGGQTEEEVRVLLEYCQCYQLCTILTSSF